MFDFFGISNKDMFFKEPVILTALHYWDSCVEYQQSSILITGRWIIPHQTQLLAWNKHIT